MTGRRIWALAVLVPLITVGVLLLESDLDHVLIPAYQPTVGAGTTAIDIDLAAVEELERRGIDVCPASGPAMIPDDLAARAAADCEPFDGHGGAGYVVGMTLAVLAGAGIARKFGNRAGALLTFAVALDAAGALFGAYAVRAWSEDWPGVAVAGTLGVVLATVMLVVVVPALILHIPTGRLRTRRWRTVLWIALFVAVALIVGGVTYPVVIGSVVNPLAGPWSLATADGLLGLGWAAWMIVLVLAAVSLLWRLYDGAVWLRARRAARSLPSGGDPAPAVTSQTGSGI